MEIRSAFADDSGRGEFIILSEADQAFIQASGEGDGPYTPEYREGGDEIHIVRNLPKRISAIRIAELYLDRWHIETGFQEFAESLESEIQTLGYSKARSLVSAWRWLSTTCCRWFEQPFKTQDGPRSDDGGSLAGAGAPSKIRSGGGARRKAGGITEVQYDA